MKASPKLTPIRDTRPQDSVGMSRVWTIVQGRGLHGWQPYHPNNDNGVDGIIIKRKRTIDTGEIIFVQVKCGTGNGYYKATQNRPKHFGVNVGKEYIESHRPKWEILPGPAILVYVDYKTEKAWWTDLKNNDSFTDTNKSIILIPKSQRFGAHSFGNFNKLKGYLSVDPLLKEIILSRDDVSYFNIAKKSPKEAAKDFYKKWSLSNERTNPALGEIIISREGWRHLSRKGRKSDRILQSWSLLGAAKRILQTITKAYQLRVNEYDQDDNGNYVITDYISLRARVIFPQRVSTIVQVVLFRKRVFNSVDSLTDNQIRFLSVYEAAAGKKQPI